MTFHGNCEICGNPVEPHHTPAWPLQAECWEIGRPGGGANHIVNRRRQPGRITHWTCLEPRLRRQKLGLEGQETLIPE